MAERWPAAGGLLFAVSSVVAGASLPAPPHPDSTAATVRSYLVDHHDAVVASSLVSVVAALGLLVLLAGLRQRTSGVPALLVSGAGAMTVGFAVLGGLLQAGLAQVLPSLHEDGAVLALFTVARTVFYDAPAIGMALVLLGAVAALPRWLGAAGAVVAVLGLVDGLGDAGSRSGFPAPLGLAGFLLTVAWVAAASWTIFREEGARLPLTSPAVVGA